jgi:hypothetical protein
MFRLIRQFRRKTIDFAEKLRRWFNPTSDEVRIDMTQSLPEHETVECYIFHARADSGRISLMATGRHLVIYRRWFMRRRYDFFHWREFSNVVLSEGFWRTRVILDRSNGPRLRIRRLALAQGRLLAGHARHMIAEHNAHRIAVGRHCPFCYEPVKFPASVCPNCHRELPVHVENAPRGQQPPQVTDSQHSAPENPPPAR